MTTEHSRPRMPIAQNLPGTVQGNVVPWGTSSEKLDHFVGPNEIFAYDEASDRRSNSLSSSIPLTSGS